LDAEERHRRLRDRGDLDDLELQAALLQRVRVPRAGDPERGLALQEGVLRRGAVDLRADQAFLVPAVDDLRVLEQERARHADVRRVEVAGLVRAEDVAAEAREERVHVVRVPTRALLDGDAEGEVRLLLLLEGRRLELVERRRRSEEHTSELQSRSDLV